MRRTGPGISPVWHSHEAIELNLVTAGRGVYFLENGQYDLSPGVLVWLLPHQSHRLMPGPDLQLWLLTCPADRCERDLLDDVARHPRRVLAREDALSLDRLFAHVSQDADEPRLYRAGLDYALRSARHVSVSGPDAAAPPLHPAVVAALRVLRAGPDVPSAGVLAAKCGVSQDYLRELLVEQTGRGFVEWRNRSRLERFQILYQESGDLLTAALAAGFGSYTQFHRVFSEVVGVTPGEWVKGPVKGAAPVTAFSPAPDRASSRMIWYPLAEVAIVDLRPFLPEDFLDELELEGEDEPPPIPSHVAGSYDLRRFEPDLVRSLAERSPEGGRLLEEAFRRTDLMAGFAAVVGQWSDRLNDLAVLITAHIATAWASSNGKPPAGGPLLSRLRARVRRALWKRGALEHLDPEMLQRLAAAVCAQGYIAYAASVASGASGRADIRERVVAALRSTMKQTYGWDPVGSDLSS